MSCFGYARLSGEFIPVEIFFARGRLGFFERSVPEDKKYYPGLAKKIVCITISKLKRYKSERMIE